MDNTVQYTPLATGEARLIVIEKGILSETVLSAENSVGRGTPSYRPEILLRSPIASRRHGVITLQPDGYHYSDCGSTNGTFINEQLYRGGESGQPAGKKLEDNDILRIVSEAEAARPDDVVMIYIAHARRGDVWKELIPGEDADEITIGRSASQGVALADTAVSRNHASFFKSRGVWAVIDHGSTNGVFVNNLRITEPVYIRPLDCIRIARSTFVWCNDRFWYSSAARAPEAQPELAAKEPAGPARPVERIGPAESELAAKAPADGGSALRIRIIEKSVWQKFKKQTILQDINVDIQRGEMVLILGGSGAGKTTFMNAVMGYEKAEGSVIHGDIDIYNEYDRMKYDIGYVPQQDLLRLSDTVYNTLKNAAEMKMPRRTTAEEKEARIEAVLELLGLSRESLALVRKLSGGQRKRLSIAVEFIADPSLFFLDEPDSGLDGVMAKSLMASLRRIADARKIVMVITHSPDRVAEHFDKVIVLAKSIKDNCGHLAFFGSPQAAYAFFGTDSMEGIVKRINRTDEGGEGLSDYFIEKFSDVKN
jgi:ABC-type multidrug transport system ATPase subunit/pSer/pThr/pTyr-binding forkhead associated (FHA) protein